MGYAAAVALGLTALVVILQLVLMIQVSKIKKELSLRRRPGHDNNSKKNFYNKNSAPQTVHNSPNKNVKNQGPRPNQVQGNKKKIEKKPVATIDNSLRDINLRLKNAEKNQEKARQKINETDLNSNKGNSNSRNNNNMHKPNRNGNIRPKDVNSNQDNFSSKPVEKNEILPSNLIEKNEILPSAPIEKTESIPVVVPEDNSETKQSFGRGNATVFKRRELDTSDEKKVESQPESLNSNQNQKEINFGRR